MASVLIVYGSITGNTEHVATVIEQVLSKQGATCKTVDAGKADPKGLCDGYDLIFFGCSTWGHETIELADDFIELFDNFEKINAKGKDTAVFGCGDTAYEYYCGAVDVIAEKLEEMGARVINTYRIDGDPEAEDSETEEWAGSVYGELK